MKKFNLFVLMLLVVVACLFMNGCAHKNTKIVTPPTCTEEGYTTYVCKCGDSYVDNYVKALGHKFGEWEIVKEATDLEAGLKVRKCVRCDKEETEVILMLNHTHNYTIEITEATCLNQGYTTYICACGEYYTDDYVNPLGHTYGDWKVVKEPTVNENGLKEKKCVRCNEKQIEEILSLEHTHNYHFVVVEPTCEDRGFKIYTCECGSIYKSDYVDALGHKYSEWEVIKKATETETGLKEKICNTCGDKQFEDIPMLNHVHSYTSKVTAPTCIEEGYTVYVCKCGHSYKDNEKDMLGHNYGEWVVVREATEEEVGLKEKVCIRCNDIQKEEIPMLVHIHNYTSVVTDPTCTTLGFTTNTCECGYSYITDYVSEYGHDYVTTVIKPTCTKQGYTVYKCSECGNSYKNNYKEKLEHNYESVITDPTDTEEGYTTYTCTECGDSYKGNIKPLYSEGLDFELMSSKVEYRVTGIGTCKDVHVVIPDEYKGLPVVEIGEKAFFGNELIISIILPETIISIKDKAFSDCENLIEITMKDDIDMGTDVFRGSIHIVIVFYHILKHVDYKAPSCTEAGNIEHYYCEHCNMYFEDKYGNNRIYDVFIPSAHNFVSGVCTKCGKIQESILIVEIDELAHLGKFPLGTLENAIGLPEKIGVYTADGKRHELNVAWDLSGYDKTKSGEYLIQGIIQTGEFFYSSPLTNRVSVGITIYESMVGTADIVFVLDISGSMGDEIDNVKDNIAAFAKAMEEKGVNGRFGIITYSDFTLNEPEEESIIIKNGASDWFTSASECANAIDEIVLAYGGDTPETAIDGLMLANTLETRKDARVFYILVTDANYKVDNNYGVLSMSGAIEILEESNVSVSIITDGYSESYYTSLSSRTNGIIGNINGSFSSILVDELTPIIFSDVIS